MKPENVLVHRNFNGTAENWVAKLTDFANSIEGLDPTTDRQHEMAYTPLYSPPEIPDGRGNVQSFLVEKADVWGWGMLLWYVMIDGQLVKENFRSFDQPHPSNNRWQALDESTFNRLKRTGELAAVAARSTTDYLTSTHMEGEVELIGKIADQLRLTLANDPHDRPSIADLYEKCVNLQQDPRMRTIDSDNDQTATDMRRLVQPVHVKPISELPFFNVSRVPWRKISSTSIIDQMLDHATPRR